MSIQLQATFAYDTVKPHLANTSQALVDSLNGYASLI